MKKILKWLRLYQCIVLDKHFYEERVMYSVDINKKKGTSDLKSTKVGFFCKRCESIKPETPRLDRINCRCESIPILESKIKDKENK